ncbi:hypothetical protein TNCT_22651 [Trichonephila clavata]|uniref:Uncharacterized protein n=1 Tax=Trichonephila clavata TaxID=2740835 RepID=A0A8X6FQC2_TRICU|nr:hypothetical protein TNCT_22651 [Trichonephila clavata]
MTKRQLHCVFCDKSPESKDCFLAQNWSLDKKKEAIKLLGIKEPTEKISREEVVKFFNDTLSTDFDGCYMVRLPWTNNSSPPDNTNIAEKITCDSNKTHFVRKIF